MRLADLNATFLSYPHTTDGCIQGFNRVDGIEKAGGVQFLCPACFLKAGRTDVGVHSVICWVEGVSQEYRPRPGRWKLVGSGLHDLTLGPVAEKGASSVQLRSFCQAHFWVKDGQITGLTPKGAR